MTVRHPPRAAPLPARPRHRLQTLNRDTWGDVALEDPAVTVRNGTVLVTWDTQRRPPGVTWGWELWSVIMAVSACHPWPYWSIITAVSGCHPGMYRGVTIAISRCHPGLYWGAIHGCIRVSSHPYQGVIHSCIRVSPWPYWGVIHGCIWVSSMAVLGCHPWPYQGVIHGCMGVSPQPYRGIRVGDQAYTLAPTPRWTVNHLPHPTCQIQPRCGVWGAWGCRGWKVGLGRGTPFDTDFDLRARLLAG